MVELGQPKENYALIEKKMQAFTLPNSVACSLEKLN
jgi:hypothetical protein